MRSFRFIAPCLSALVLFGAAAAETLPLDLFAKNAAYQGVKISPDGRALAALAQRDDRNMLVVIDLEQMAITGSIRVDLNQSIGQFFWASNERIVAKVLSRQSDNDRLADFGEIFAMDTDGSDSKLIYGYRVSDMSTGTRIKQAGAEWAYASILDPLHEDDSNILIASYPFTASRESRPTVYRLDVRRGTTTQVTRTPLVDASLIGSSDQKLWAAVGADLEGRQEVAWRDDDDLNWSTLLEADDLMDHIRIVGVDSDSRSLLALSNFTTPTTSLVRIDVDSGEFTTLLSDPRHDARSTVYDTDERTVLGVCYAADRPRCDYLDPAHPTSRLHASLQQAFPQQFASIVNWTEDGSGAVLYVWSDRNPGDYFLFDAEAKKVDFLLSSREWIDPNQMAPMTPIEYEARDGTTIAGYLTRPLDAEGEGPMVVLVHGGPHGPRDTWAFDTETQMLANRGYSVLQVNFRGSGGYGREFEQSGHRRWGTAIQDDITDGVKWAIEQGHADPERICIYGASFGGYSAIMSAAREPDLYRCAVGNVGVYDMDLMFRKGDIPDNRGGPEYLSLVLSEDREIHQAQSPVHHAGKIKADLMIAYGQQDERAPPEQSLALTRALDAAGKDYELVVSRREGHGIAKASTRLDYFQKLTAFLDRHLSAENPPDEE